MLPYAPSLFKKQNTSQYVYLTYFHVYHDQQQDMPEMFSRTTTTTTTEETIYQQINNDPKERILLVLFDLGNDNGVALK